MIDTLEAAGELERAVREEMNGRALVAVSPMQSRRRSFSSVLRYRLRFEDRELDVCLKVHRRANTGFQEECVLWAKEEFEVLQALYAAARDGSPLSVVRPLLFLPRLPAVLLETHPGRVLNTLLKARWLGLRGPEIGREWLERACRLAGAGLREMHRLTSEDGPALRALAVLRPIVVGRDAVLTATDELFGSAAAHCSGEVQRAAERGYRSARDAFGAATALSYPLVGAHGDCTPLNVFVHESRVTYFDLVNYHRNHAFEDVSRFVTYLFFLRKNPWAFPPSFADALASAFLDGYGIPSPGTDPVLRFFFQRSMFRTLNGGLGQRGDRALLSPLYEGAMRRVFAGWVAEGMALA